MIRFGTGGWRAIIGDDFIKSNIQKVAQAICNMAKDEQKADKPIVIGYDRRFLSRDAAKWVAEIITGNGIQVIFMERSVPTPLTMFIVQSYQLHYGVEITASHNPSAYNGIKLIVEEGRDAPVETTKRLENIIDTVDNVEITQFDKSVENGMISYLKNPFNNFIDNILKSIDKDAIKQRGMRILFDPMHGSGIYPLQVILNETRCTVDTINSNLDAYFGGYSPEPTENTLKTLQRCVVKGNYDLGIALDGDGDRLGIIDKNGNYIDSNSVLCILYYYLHEYKKWNGPVVRNCATTHMLDVMADSFQEKCIEVPVGFKHISSAITKYDAVLGGESSGGLTVRGHINGKDSIYAATLLVEAICKMNKSPTEVMEMLTKRYGSFVMVENNIKFPKDKKEYVYHAIMEEKKIPNLNKKNIEKVSYEDGCKIYFKDNSFVICRFSGTEPILRIFAEAETKEKATSYIDKFMELYEQIIV